MGALRPAVARRADGAGRLAQLLVLCLLLAPWSPQQRAGLRLAGAQGLAISNEQLGAGETATLSQFERFADALSIWNSNDGGGRGSSKGRTGSALAADPKSFSKLLLALYSVAGAPAVYNSFNRSQTRGGRSYQPSVRDQGTCDSCVAQAIAAAIEASLASTLQQDASSFSVSAQTLYYCTQGWRSCNTGWEIQQALAQTLDATPWMVRPTSCASVRELTTPAIEPEISAWAPICAASLAQPCAAAVKSAAPEQQRWLKCSFRALSTFSEIQAAIRAHGSVVTRMTIYNDFAAFFSGNNSQGFGSQPYKVTRGARPLFGHAVVITGYDNNAFTWTVQNSWGCSGAGCASAAAGTNKPGMTQDGLFRIRMGDAGIGTPDQTFAVDCAPSPGSPADLHSTRPWRVRSDMPLQLLRPEDVNDLSQGACFSYTPNSRDTPVAIADAFQLDIRQLARDNPSIFPIITSSLLIRSAMTAQQMADVIHEVNAAAPVNSSGAAAPYFRCRTYNGAVIGRPKECRRGDASGFTPCAGLSPCTLFFPQHELAAPIQGKVLKVCNISAAVPADRPEDRVVPYFADADARQGRALKALLQVARTRAGSTRPLKDVQVPSSLKEQCNTRSWLPDSSFDGSGVGVICLFGNITFISVGWVSLAKTPDARRDTERLINALLSTPELATVGLSVIEGELPPQLGGVLDRLELLIISYDCMSGGLPPNLLAGLPKLRVVTISRAADSKGDASSCGIAGPIPREWGAANTSINTLTLPSNRLSGTLPSFSKWSRLETLDLSNNAFVGSLPAAWALLPGVRDSRGSRINVSSNALEGVFPYEWKSLSGLLGSLYVQNNIGLRGCIPLDKGTELDYSNTGITGKCAGARTEAGELAALQQLLPKVLTPAAALNASAWQATLKAVLRDLQPGLRAVIPSGADAFTKSTPDGSLGVGVAVINGIAHVVALYAFTPAGIDLSYLPRLVARLPQLRNFQCYQCYCRASISKDACTLPPNLAAVAPPSMVSLDLANMNGLASTLPPSWGSWRTLQKLGLDWNAGIAGPLPASWANMASLETLTLSDCGVSGTLPPSWGSGPMASKMQWLNLAFNKGLQGTIPQSWGGFTQALVGIFGNPFIDWDNSCRPDGVDMLLDVTLPVCSALASSQASTLAAIKGVLQAGSSQPARVLPSWDTANPGSTEVGTRPNFCTKWQGVTCDSTNNVVGLKLAGPPDRQAPFNLDADIIPLLLKLPKLVALDASRTGLSGNLSSPAATRLVLQLPLQHLNLSGNPSIGGELPQLWAASKLQSLDLSDCNISGPLPPTWAALQQLRVLRLAAGSQGGNLQSTLPSEWGLLVQLVELDISGHAGITGLLPAVWAEAAAMRAVAAGAVAAASDRSAKADTAMAAAQAGPTGSPNGVAAASAGSSSWSPAQHHAQIMAAAGEAVAARRMVSALQAAATGSDRGDASAAAAGSGSGLGLHQLQVLRLAGCGLTGGLPASFSGLQQLRVIDLSHNTGLGEALPPEWGTLSRLQNLELANCSLVGGLPATYVTLAGLTALDLSDNQLGGTLPALPFASLVKLAVLNLSGNAFEGPLPALWLGMAAVQVIDVSRNALTGPGLPAEWEFLVAGEVRKLQQLRLSPGNPCMAVSNETVQSASGGACVVVPSIDAATANMQGKCAVIFEQQPDGCPP